MLNAEIKIFPGKEMKALDMAEILDASVITSGIIQGCNIQNLSGALTLTEPGRILIRGRLGYFQSGVIPTSGISTSGTYKVLAVCDLSATQGNEFYIDYFSTATGGDYDAISSRRSNQQSFNAADGVEFVELGTATIDASTGNVTQWTAENATVKRDADAYSALQQEITNVATTSHTYLQRQINAWSTYLRNRTFASARFVQEAFVIPSFTLAAGQKVSCTFPAIRGTTFRATGANARVATRPSWETFTQQYTTITDGTSTVQIPSNIDSASVRYVAIGIAGVLFTKAAYKPSGASQAVGKNETYCVVNGWGLFGSDYDKQAVVYIKNVGTAEAIVDVNCTLMFVRRG